MIIRLLCCKLWFPFPLCKRVSEYIVSYQLLLTLHLSCSQWDIVEETGKTTLFWPSKHTNSWSMIMSFYVILQSLKTKKYVIKLLIYQNHKTHWKCPNFKPYREYSCKMLVTIRLDGEQWGIVGSIKHLGRSCFLKIFQI